MAFVDPNAPNDPNAPAQSQQSVQAPVSAGGAGVSGSVGTKAAPATPGVNVPAQPSAQLSAYLNANKDQSSALGQNVASSVSNQVNAAGAAIQPAADTYAGNLYSVPTDTNVNAAVASSPSSLTPDQKATFQAELGAASKAPNSAATFETTAPYQEVTQGIQNAVQAASLWNSGNNPASISTALSPFEGSNATSGDKTLDALLLSQTPEAYGQIQSAAAPAANLQNQLSSATSKADAALLSAIAADQAATPAAIGAGQAYAQNLTSYLNKAVSDAQTGSTTQNAAIINDLAAGTPTASDLTALGLTADQWAALSSDVQAAQGAGAKIDLTQYLTQGGPGDITTANIATPTQYADISALQSLLGTNAPAVPLDPSQAALAGTAPTSLSKFDYTGADTVAQVANLAAQEKAIQDNVNAMRQAAQQNNQRVQNPYPDIPAAQAEYNALADKIAALEKSNPSYFVSPTGGQGGAGGGGPDWGNIAQFVFPVGGLANPISQFGNAANDIGSWLGI